MFFGDVQWTSPSTCLVSQFGNPCWPLPSLHAGCPLFSRLLPKTLPSSTPLLQQQIHPQFFQLKRFCGNLKHWEVGRWHKGCGADVSPKLINHKIPAHSHKTMPCPPLTCWFIYHSYLWVTELLLLLLLGAIKHCYSNKLPVQEFIHIIINSTRL